MSELRCWKGKHRYVLKGLGMRVELEGGVSGGGERGMKIKVKGTGGEEMVDFVEIEKLINVIKSMRYQWENRRWGSLHEPNLARH
jgi:hypothetical protein